jgi:hypothetical protein
MRPQKKSMSYAFQNEDLEIEEDEKFVKVKRAVGAVHHKEVEYAERIESFADNLAHKLGGYTSTPWWTALYSGTLIHALLTMLCCFYKSDFINLTVVVMLLHVHFNALDVKKWHFRAIVFCILMSWVFDLFWMFFHMGSWWSKYNPEHGGVELGFRRFCVIFTFFSFLFRIILFLVAWKISVEFDRLFKARGTSLDGINQRF